MRPTVAKIAVCVALLAGCGTNAALDVDAGAAAPSVRGAAGANAGEGSATSLPNGSTGGPATDSTAGGAGGTTPSRRALSVAVGFRYACVLLEDHTVKCWGANTPVLFASQPVLAIAVTQDGDTCAIMGEGGVTCWNGVAFGPQLPAGRRAVGLAMGQSGGCANLDDGSGVCWSDPQPGVGLTQWMLVPPIGAPMIRQICDNCGVLLFEDGTVSSSSFGAYEVPHLLDGHAATSLAWDHGLSSGWCATLADGGAFCNGVSVPSSAVMTALSIDESSLGQNVCALDASGKVSCWGITAGCADADPSQSYWCVSARNGDGGHDVVLGQPARAIDTGSSPFPVTCAVLADGSVKCWGGLDISSREYGPDPIMGASVTIIDTPNGPAYGPWRAIDLDALP